MDSHYLPHNLKINGNFLIDIFSGNSIHKSVGSEVKLLVFHKSYNQSVKIEGNYVTKLYKFSVLYLSLC